LAEKKILEPIKEKASIKAEEIKEKAKVQKEKLIKTIESRCDCKFKRRNNEE
jgi:hypothetical protein